ncbi:MAG: DUF87 domain-containing protein, partial [Victivallaceae bacterium]|nr:DUF87 domain-containing protein [Victivallaceae bacterium]
YFTIKRDKIPVNTLGAAYMIAPGIGYIQLDRFGATSGDEVKDAVTRLQKEGMTSLILDLENHGAGYLGAVFSYYALLLFGLASYAGATVLLLHFARRFMPNYKKGRTFWLGFLLFFSGVMLLCALSPAIFSDWMVRLGLGNEKNPLLSLSGGILGQFFAAPPVPELEIPPGALRMLLGAPGTTIIAWALAGCGAILIALCDYVTLPWQKWRESLPDANKLLPKNESKAASEEDAGKEKREIPPKKDDVPPPETDDFPEISEAVPPRNAAAPDASFLPEIETPPARPAPRPAPVSVPASRPAPADPELGVREVASGERNARATSAAYELPSVNLLAKGTDTFGEDPAEIAKKKDLLQKTLDDFAIAGHVSGYITGPRVTRFEITLDPGVNVKKVEQIQDNITMALSATSVRVLAPIPGRPVVGVEISNHRPEAVFMRSVIESDAWTSGKAEIPLALGKDVSGKPVVLDLAKAPHLLIAGSTGTGKSVCTNSLIVSLLYHFRPDELKLIMVDPKVVEFEDYRKLPHLLTPLINDSSKVPIALRWAVNEMEKRYRILAHAGVKKLIEFNRRPVPENEEFDDNGLPIPAKMPYLVIIIDELADLMMTEARKDAETAITRIAQKGRAAGIHIVVATQRPSTNIITGVIKANLPTRFCFQVRSMIDSRVVLDTNGAEKLLGTGDMLLMSPSSMLIERIQGAWVKDEDIKTIVRFVSSQAEQDFDDNVVCDEVPPDEKDGEDDDYVENPVSWDIDPIVKKYLKSTDDDTMRRALEVVVTDRKISTSYLQRRLKIGYNRAAELIDQMEERGIVGPASGSGNKREILILDDLINHDTENQL